jgi:hypothetical protein
MELLQTKTEGSCVDHDENISSFPVYWWTDNPLHSTGPTAMAALTPCPITSIPMLKHLPFFSLNRITQTLSIRNLIYVLTEAECMKNKLTIP